ncbi:hypothetical protein [Rhodococcoides yunnanense]|uniref:hypothetical protein n=1 Tax=Rhodococcoides yunnanense TaxID=278209 RepID=UPI0022B0D7DF|nr:hypothetical protein [Rhodococcus yunnanensis]MCZ4277774.1 hypothetical protein [Rhodococcus yunnanensis]
MAKTHQTAWTAGAATVMLAVAAAAVVMISTDHHDVTAAPPPPDVFHDVITVAGLLDALPVVDDLESVSRWPDDQRSVKLDVRAGNDHGCDTKNLALAAELDEVTFVPGAADCVVAHGVLTDPYTGVSVQYDATSENDSVALDYVYPLDAAWSLGAAAWGPDQRQRFISDVSNNIVVAGTQSVEDKAQRGLGRWHPNNGDRACAFAAKYLRVAQAYSLPVTRGDAAAATQLCGLDSSVVTTTGEIETVN